MSLKRRREQSSFETQTIEIYEDLANDNEEIRLKAATKLLSKLSTDSESGQEQLDRVLKRLIRGLCSSRKSARVGFSVALTELLSQHINYGPETVDGPSLEDSAVVTNLHELTRPNGNISGQEERDHRFGRLFGAEAIIKSKILFNARSSIESWEQLLDLIYELAKKKVWLREECGWVLCNAILTPSRNGKVYAQSIVDKLHSNALTKTPEGVALWITAQKAFPDLMMPKHVFHDNNPLHQKERTNLAKILKQRSAPEPTADPKDRNAQSGFWVSKVHFVWDIVFSNLLEPRSKQSSFSEIWREAVDDGLFSASSSNERKYWGFLLFQHYVTTVPLAQLPTLFGKNLKHCIVNQSYSEERYLHSIAERSIEAVFSRASRDLEAAVLILDEIIDTDFNTAKKSKIVERLLAGMDLNTLEKIVPRFAALMDQTFTASKNDKAMFSSRQLLADMMVSIVRAQPLQDFERDISQYRNIVSAILKIFSHYAYSPTESSNEATREMFQLRIASCFTKTIAVDSADRAFHPCYVLKTIRERVPKFALIAAPEVLETVEGAVKTLKKISEKEQSATERAKETLKAFKLLLVITILQVYNGEVDTINVIDELQGSYKSLKSLKYTGIDDEGAEALIEVVIGFVSKPSLLFRRLVAKAFPALAWTVNVQGLQSMIEVLETEENSTGLDKLFKKDDEDQALAEDEDDSDVEMIDEDASGVEFDLVEDRPQGSSSLSSSENEDETGDEDEDEDDPELAAFDAGLARALGTRRADEDLAIKGEESSDEDMNDEQMEALDAHLETMFKQRKEAEGDKKQKQDAKKEKQDAPKTVAQFKCRVIELLEIYVKKQFSNPMALSIVNPVLQVINSTRNKQVSSKASGLVRDYMKLYKYNKGKEIKGQAASDCRDTARTLLSEVHEMVLQDGTNAFGVACSKASLLLTKAILANGGSLEEIVEQYDETKRLCSKDRKSVNRLEKYGFFTDWQAWRANVK